jgi:single-stranded-DNA-specific exonuclease
MNRQDGICHGSGRSIEGFNLHAALTHCAEHLDRYGGHNMAAGLHLVEPKLGAFTEAFIEHASSLIEPEAMCRWLTVDCEAGLDELTTEAVLGLDELQPCGAGNPDAQVLLRGCVVADRPMPMGAQAKHLSVQLRSESGRRVRAVAWGFGEHRDRFVVGSRVDVVVRPKISTWNGGARVEPEIRDVGAGSR